MSKCGAQRRGNSKNFNRHRQPKYERWLSTRMGSSLQPAGLRLRHKATIQDVAICADGMDVLTAGADGTVGFWEVSSGSGAPRTIRDVASGGALRSIAQTGQDQLALGTDTGLLWLVHKSLFDSRKRPPKPIRAHRGRIWALACDADGSTVLSGSDDQTARLWDCATGKPLLRALEHESPVLWVALSDDGSKALTGCSDGSVRLWDVTSARLIEQLPSHHAAVAAVAFQRGENALFSAGMDMVIRCRRRPQSIPGDADLVLLWAEVFTGMEVDPNGEARVLEPRIWQERRQRLRRADFALEAGS